MEPPHRIRLLSSEVIDLIAAGEVVERPSSVVKELVENALDAGARALWVDIAAGGSERISISDDGGGMSPDDAERAIERHATSKLDSAEDLFAIGTLGFRGEALSSIAAVSRLALTTRRHDDPVGLRLEVEGGAVQRVEQVGCPAGTTVDVRDLFFNTPARRKFLRSPATEQAHIVDVATRVVLGARRAGVVVQSGERRLLDIPEDAPEAARVRAALGRRVDAVFPFSTESQGVRVSGYLTRPEIDRRDGRGMWLFVNGRAVRDRVLQRAVLDGYRSMLERGRFPVLVVFVELASQAVDVNVHPQKLEVRFRDSSAVFRAVSAAVTRALAQTPWLHEPSEPHHQVPPINPTALLGPSSRVAEQKALGYGAAGWTYRAPFAPKADGRERRGGGNAEPIGGFFARLRPLGQVLGLFLVCEGEDALWIIDQHAAHERIVFERLRGQARGGRIERQNLLFPQVVDVPAATESLLEEHHETLSNLGFDFEAVGPHRYALKTIPAALGEADALALATDLLEGVASGALRDCLIESAAEAQDRLLIRVACHAAVRMGDALGEDEMRALLTQMDTVDFGGNCPHGRPVHHRITRAELERLFHR